MHMYRLSFPKRSREYALVHTSTGFDAVDRFSILVLTINQKEGATSEKGDIVSPIL